MPAYLIRHAHAGSRSAWQGDDSARPLSTKGWKQAQRLVADLADLPVGVILSSPATRCVQTVEPLALARELDIETCPELAEGAAAGPALDLLERLAAKDPVLAGHGDLIPKLVRRLVGLGMQADEGAISHKGSMWVVDFEAGQPVRGRYVRPD